jgi:NADPH2:quinone reductase
MRAAYYEKNGSARDVLRVAEVETPEPGPGEVRIKLKTSGVNPSDVKAREGRTRKLSYPRVIPHSDGAGEIDMIGGGVPAGRQGRAGLGLEWAVEAPIRHLRGIHRAPFGAGGPAAGGREL